jgi:hypothetical protein
MLITETAAQGRCMNGIKVFVALNRSFVVSGDKKGVHIQHDLVKIRLVFFARNGSRSSARLKLPRAEDGFVFCTS